MFPLSLNTYISVGCAFLAMIGLGYGRYESSKLDAYKVEVAAIAQKQIDANKAKLDQQNLINKATKENYEAKLSALKFYYGGLHNSSSGQMPSISISTGTTNASSSDQLLACAYTTQQLVSLQDWIKEQVALK